jgi:hypothetical protein
MKKQLLTWLTLFGLLPAGQAGLFIQGTTGQTGTSAGSVANPTIVDGNPGFVIANTMDLSSAGLGLSLSTLTVTLNISGGMNNGLYGYLVAPNGTLMTLMNQPGVGVDGFGATGSGMNITLLSSSAGGGYSSIQSVTSGSTLSGTYFADGDFSTLNGINPNGSWTLYFSDTIAGGRDATLSGWSLDITAVPEPVNVALGVFGGCLAFASLLRRGAGKLKHPDHHCYECTCVDGDGCGVAAGDRHIHSLPPAGQ